MIWYFSEGMMSAQDSLTSHAFGMRDSGNAAFFTSSNLLTSACFVAGTRHWTYVSVIVMSIIALAGTILMVFSPLVVSSVFGLEGNLAQEVCAVLVILFFRVLVADSLCQTVIYVMCLIPALWFQTAFRVIQKYLQAQHVMLPAIGCYGLGLAGKVIGNMTQQLQR